MPSTTRMPAISKSKSATDRRPFGCAFATMEKAFRPKFLDHGRAGHFGLTGMRERAKQVGAELAIWSRPGTGTAIDLSLAGKTAYGTSARGSWFGRFQQKR